MTSRVLPRRNGSRFTSSNGAETDRLGVTLAKLDGMIFSMMFSIEVNCPIGRHGAIALYTGNSMLGPEARSAIICCHASSSQYIPPSLDVSGSQLARAVPIESGWKGRVAGSHVAGSPPYAAADANPTVPAGAS